MDTSEIRGRIEADLRRARTDRDAMASKLGRLDRKIEELASTLAVLEQYAETPAIGGVALSRDRSGSLKDVALHVITQAAEPMDVPSIATAILAANAYNGDQATLERSLRGIISRATREGSIAKMRRGLYGAPGMMDPEKKSPETAGTVSGVAGPPPTATGR